MKLLKLFITFALIWVGTAAMAVDDSFTVDNFTYTITGDNTVELSKVVDKSKLPEELIIKGEATNPNDNQTYMVTSIRGYTFQSNQQLKSITIPANVKSIGERAFTYCEKLATVNFANGSVLESIGSGCFSRCRTLSSITIPASVKSIGDDAFYYCENLATVNFANGSVLESISEECFYGCSTLSSITIPASVKSIGSYAFSDCSKLATINISSSVTNIGELAFDCEVIVSEDNSNYSSADGVLFNKEKTSLLRCPITKEGNYTIPNSVTTIQHAAFCYCDKISTIIIPDNVTSIGGSAFYNCAALTTITIPKNVTIIEAYTFSQCTSLKSVYFQEGSLLNEIGESAFASCENLLSIDIPDGVTAIYDEAFSECTNLQSVVFSNKSQLAYIGKKAFFDCKSLKSLIIPEIVEEIDNEAFTNAGITTMTLPESVTTVGDMVFDGCTSLESIFVENLELRLRAEDYSEGCGSFIPLQYNPEVTTVYYKGYDFDYYVTLPEGVTASGVDLVATNVNKACVKKDASLTLSEPAQGYGYHAIPSDKCTINGNELTNITGDITIDNIKLLSHTDITVSSIADQTYNGNAITPTITVSDKQTDITNECDITYQNNINASNNAKVLVTAKTSSTKYGGSTSKTFTINPLETQDGALTITKYGYKTTAVIDGSSESGLRIDNQIPVDEVTYTRKFESGLYTVMLPFGFNVEAASLNGNFYKLSSIVPVNQTVSKAELSDPIKTVEANKPYIFQPGNGGINEIKIKGNITLEIPEGAPLTNDCESKNWKLHGVYSQKIWDNDNLNEYGFAVGNGDVAAGEFVHFVSGAWINPTRCYLEYNKSGFAKSTVKLPEKIVVVFPGEEINSDYLITPIAETAPSTTTKVWSANRTIFIESAAGTEYHIIDLVGRTLKTSVTTSDREEVVLDSNVSGIIIVKIDNNSFKINY